MTHAIGWEEDERIKVSGQENELVTNLMRFNSSAKLVYDRNDYTSAAILYFKALFTILDLVILRNKGFIPKDHSERFRILEADYSEYYKFLDMHFLIYQESYRTSIKKEDCELIKDYVEKIIAEQKI